MKIEDAKTKWCPMVRHADDDGKSLCNRYGAGGIGEWNSCYADRCMMWVVDTYEIEEDGSKFTIEEGHCGLIRG